MSRERGGAYSPQTSVRLQAKGDPGMGDKTPKRPPKPKKDKKAKTATV